MGSKKKRKLHFGQQSVGSISEENAEESLEDTEDESDDNNDTNLSPIIGSKEVLSNTEIKIAQDAKSPSEEKPSEEIKSSEVTKSPENIPSNGEKNSSENRKNESIIDTPNEDNKIPESQVSSSFPESSFSHTPFEKKKDVISRNLLRLYHYLHEDRPFKEETLIQELEMGTPNAELRQNAVNLSIELENVLQENQALRESSLQTQLEYSEQIEQVEIENRTLKQKIQDIDKRIAIEMQTRAEKYQEIINQLRAQLKETMSKNEKITEVSGALVSMQERIAILFEQNEQFAKENEDLITKTTALEQDNKTMKEDLQKLEKKNDELRQKEKLQQMVIDGYKRNAE